MALREVMSHADMLQHFDDKKKNYVLLYKKGTENSDCAYRNLEEALKQTHHSFCFLYTQFNLKQSKIVFFLK